MNEDTLLSITGISVADVDAATGAVMITMSVGNGRLTLAQVTGLTFTVGDGTSDAAMTFTGTVADVNLALARVDYLGNANYAGADSLSISADDQANIGSGGAKTDTKSVAITVVAVNDAPVLTVPGAQSVNEDTLLSITGISVADVDAATGAVKITMSVANGRLTLAQITGLTFTVGDGTSDAAMTFTGTVGNVNLALARVDYLGNANYAGADSLSVSVDDQANTGSGGAKTDSRSIAITVAAVNDAPVLTVPGAQTVNEDTLLPITGISVADVDAATGAVKITMSVASGRLTLAQITGLTFTVGDGTSDAAMTFTGTVANVNLALARVDYLGNADFSGADSLSLSVDDQANTGSGGAKTDAKSVAITVAAVNDTPVLTIPGVQIVNEDTLLSITGISVADVDAATGAVKITMSVASGRLTLAQTTGLTFTVGDGTSDAAMTFTGTLANVDLALARVDYVGNANYSGADSLSISVDDQANTGMGGAKTDTKSVAITVAAVNDAPVLTVPGAQVVNEDTLLSITGITVADVDAATGPVKITMSVASGRLTLAQITGLTFTVGDGTSDAAMTFTGKVANINLALARVDYLATTGYSGSDALDISVDDQGNTGSGGTKTDSKSIVIGVGAVNDPPQLTLPGAQTVAEDTLLSITGIAVADVDAGGGLLKITVSVAQGRLTLAQVTGLAFTVGDGTSDAAMTFTGTLANLNSALARVDYLVNANYAGADTLNVSVDDQGNTGLGGAQTNSGSVAITVTAVNDAPVLTVPGAQSVNEDTLLSITGISVADVDAAAGAVKIAMSVAQGRITLAQVTGLTFTVGDGTSDAAMTFTGTLANVNLALARVDYVGNANYSGADSLSISVDDQANTGVGGAKTDTKSVAITVAAVNDAPVLTVPGAQSVNEDTLLSITGISVADVDAATGAVTITMSVANGRLTLAQITGLTFTVGDGTSDAAMTFTGTVANVNLALARVDYLGNANYAGADSLSVSVDDQANTGSGGAKTDSRSIAITVAAVNDAPVLTVPSAQTVDEDTLLPITGISVADVDAATGAVKITMSVASGRLTLAQITGLTFTVGDGTSDAAMTFTGTLANLNLALTRVDYLGNANFNGSDSLSISVDDQVNTGSGGAKTDSKSVGITVVPVNDPPNAGNDDDLVVLKGSSNQSLGLLDNDYPGPLNEEDQRPNMTISGLTWGSQVDQDMIITEQGGTATVSTDRKTVLYTPPLETFVGTDTFTYTISDGNGGTDSATVVVDVVDAVPSDISGVVYLDVNNNGERDPSEIALAGVEVSLHGTNIRDVELKKTVKTDVNGVFVFEDILPNKEGSQYQIMQGYFDKLGNLIHCQPKFLLDGSDSIGDATADYDGEGYDLGVAGNDMFTGIELGLYGHKNQDGDSYSSVGNYAFGERGLSSKFISIAQYLSSTKKGLAVATNMQGEDFWFTILQGWEGVVSVHAQMASDLTSCTLTIVDVNGGTQVKTIGYQKYNLAGDHTTGEYIIYFNGTAAELGFSLPGGSLAVVNGGGAEGEAVEMYADDYAQEADEVFARGDWA